MESIGDSHNSRNDLIHKNNTDQPRKLSLFRPGLLELVAMKTEQDETSPPLPDSKTMPKNNKPE